MAIVYFISNLQKHLKHLPQVGGLLLIAEPLLCFPHY